METYVSKAKREIIELIKEGVVPNTISCFSDLHDYIDANSLGGFTEEDYILSENLEFENSVQDSVDEWIKTGALLEVK